ncbi:MAG TPA: glycine--tRNA ligase subunit beta [Campylobacteraceae bacterium]|nr:glycine--tRNA ligase subunit beta [Campylobacteraceae bacterium]
MHKDLLIEVGVEELPAIPFLKELPNIPKKWEKMLQQYHLQSDFDFYYTPRRIVFYHTAFSEKQPDAIESFYGAPVAIAFKDGEPTPAALGFAKKCGVDISEIGRAQKGGKEVLYYEKKIPGRPSEELLGEMVSAFLKSLNFGKTMRWGSAKEGFIRPVRWFVCMLGNENIDASVFGVKAAKATYPHRTHGFAPVAFDDAQSYFTLLESNGVMLDADTRREKILTQFGAIEKAQGIRIEKDVDLIEEVVAITEYPNALMGRFDAHFLTLPPEVIITSMKEHQRYFPVFEEEKLSNRFIVVSNALTDDFSKIVAGNEKVLRPRLSDALFFYENDLKRGLDNEGLKNITFMQGLGSIYDKSKREAVIAEYLDARYRLPQSPDLLLRTVMLSKADLLTDMVYEFTELQGLMGYYYAKAAGEEEDLCIALKEQYLPTGEESALPTTDFSAVVAMSVKLDTLLALFSIGQIPTGTKDPFGLRRAVVGIVKIVQDRGFAFDIGKDLAALAAYYDGVDMEKLENFFIERLTHHLGANPSVISAVLESGERDINEITKKVEALSSIVEAPNFKEIATTFKRVANIVKDVDLSSPLKIDEALFSEEAERKLYAAFRKKERAHYSTYSEKLQALFGLKPQIDAFFDHVMVNVEDEKLRTNRKNLIASIYRAFRDIAELKEVTL